MSTNLQTLIHSAEQLTPVEQVELINAVSHFLHQHYQQKAPTADFWQPQPIESIVAVQQTQPASGISTLKADFWPEDESADEFIEFVTQQHQANSAAS